MFRPNRRTGSRHNRLFYLALIFISFYLLDGWTFPSHKKPTYFSGGDSLYLAGPVPAANATLGVCILRTLISSRI